MVVQKMVVIKEKRREYKFGDLETGVVFRLPEFESPLIALERDVWSDAPKEHVTTTAKAFNAVCVSSGELWFLEADQEVIPLVASLTVADL